MIETATAEDRFGGNAAGRARDLKLDATVGAIRVTRICLIIVKTFVGRVIDRVFGWLDDLGWTLVRGGWCIGAICHVR